MNGNDWADRPDLVRVAIDTLRACCTQAWYDRFNNGRLPEDGFNCLCGAHIARDPEGWWVRDGIRRKAPIEFAAYRSPELRARARSLSAQERLELLPYRER